MALDVGIPNDYGTEYPFVYNEGDASETTGWVMVDLRAQTIVVQIPNAQAVVGRSNIAANRYLKTTLDPTLTSRWVTDTLHMYTGVAPV